MKPIIFSTPMVQAILDGRKSMTRRVIKPQPDGVAQGRIPFKHKNIEVIRDGNLVAIRHPEGEPNKQFIQTIKPRYQPRDILWVRETWAVDEVDGFVEYKANCLDEDAREIKWRPSIFMPKEAARIFLRVTGVRAERIQDIDNANCYDNFAREGIGTDDLPSGQAKHSLDMKMEFIELWDNLNAKRGYSWESNPWVWVIEFERVENP